MKPSTLFLVTGTILLLIAIGAGLYVWYKVQTLDKAIGDTQETIDRLEVEKNENVRTGTTDSSKQDTQTSVDPVIAAESTTTVIDLTKLTDTQKEILGAFGVSGQSFEVTQEMSVCVGKAIGNERFNQIVGGSAPTPLESMRLLPCFKK